MADEEVIDLNIIVKADTTRFCRGDDAVSDEVDDGKDSRQRDSRRRCAITESDIRLCRSFGRDYYRFQREAGVHCGCDCGRFRHQISILSRHLRGDRGSRAGDEGILEPVFKEVVVGHAEVRMSFTLSAVGTIAGCYITGAGSIETTVAARSRRYRYL